MALSASSFLPEKELHLSRCPYDISAYIIRALEGSAGGNRTSRQRDMTMARTRSTQRKPSVGSTQYERVHEALRKRIQSGKLPPGQRLVRRALAKDLGVSPIPVIEALHRLEQEGLVEHEPSVGARVRPLTLEQVMDDLVLREAIHSQVMRQLTGRLGPIVLSDLRRQAEQLDGKMQRGKENDPQGMQAHADFHIELARLTGSATLLRETQTIWSRRFMQMAWLAAAISVIPAPDWHSRLVDALESGDPQVADAAARYHVRRSPKEIDHVKSTLQKALSQMNETPSS